MDYAADILFARTEMSYNIYIYRLWALSKKQKNKTKQTSNFWRLNVLCFVSLPRNWNPFIILSLSHVIQNLYAAIIC